MLDTGGGDSEGSRIFNAIMGRLFRKHDLGVEGSNYISLQDKRDLSAIISNYRNCSITEYQFGEAAETAKRLNLPRNLLPIVVEDYQALKTSMNVIDFDDLMSLVYDYMVRRERR